MTDTVAQARERGYVETITGRRRYLPDLRSANATVRAAAERNAINMPIQGSSADLIKIAMVQIARVARDENWCTKLLLQVHDELVFDLYLPEKERVLEVVQDRMKNALPDLPVPSKSRPASARTGSKRIEKLETKSVERRKVLTSKF